MGREMAVLDAQRIERCQHVQCMLLHGIVGIVDRRFRPLAVATAAPVDPDDPQARRKQRRGELDPVLACEIAVDEDDTDLTLSPLAPTKLDLRRLHLWHERPYLLRPAVGAAPGGVGARGTADATAPLIIRSVPSGDEVSTVPLVTKSTTSAGYSTGLSVWMKCPLSG